MSSSLYKNRSLIPVLYDKKDIVVLSISLVLLVAAASTLYEGAYLWVNWRYDDTESLSISYNLFHGKSLSRDFIDYGAHVEVNNIAELNKYTQISNPLASKGPIFYVLLGGWLKLVGSDYIDWYLMGSIFSMILVATSIIIFYLFVKRYLGFEIAAYSTPVLALMPGLLWHSVRIRPEVLALIFAILSFYLAAKPNRSTRDALIIGVLIGLGHLTHPTALAAGVGIVIYFVVAKHRIKDAALVVLIWTLMISPWMIRNYIIFGEPFEGLGIMIPSSLAQALNIPSPNPLMKPSTNQTEGPILATSYSISKIISGFQAEFANFYGMPFFIVFVSISLMAYLRINTIKRYLIGYRNQIKVGGILGGYAALASWVSQDQDGINSFFVQIVVYLVVPLIGFVYLRLSHRRDIFSQSSTIMSLLGIYMVVSFIQYFLISFSFGDSAEVRFLYMSLIFGIPLAIIGLKKLLSFFSLIVNSKAELSKRTTAIRLYLIALLFVFVSSQAIWGVLSISSFQETVAEREYQKDMHEWIVHNTPEDAKIATDLPHAVLLRTGREAVNFLWSNQDNIQYERWVIKRFDIDYLVFYNPVSDDPTKCYICSNVGRLLYTDLLDFKLQLVYEGRLGGHIYRVIYN